MLECPLSERKLRYPKWILKPRKFFRSCLWTTPPCRMPCRQPRRARCPLHNMYLHIFALELLRSIPNNALLIEILTGEDIHIGHLVRRPHMQADMAGGNDDKA